MQADQIVANFIIDTSDSRSGVAKIQSIFNQLQKEADRFNANNAKQAQQHANQAQRMAEIQARARLRQEELTARQIGRMKELQFKSEQDRLKREFQATQNHLRAKERAYADSAKSTASNFASTLGGNFFANLGAQAVSRIISELSRLPGEAVKVATETQNALLGLRSVAAFKFIDQAATEDALKNLRLVKGGVVSLSEAATTVKNLLQTGFNLKESVDLFERFSDAAAFGKQAALEYGQAIRGASEGIRNQNSLLVDNVGITKNLSVIMEERGFKLQDLNDATKRASALQALYNGIMTESNAQVGDADKLLGTYTGTIAAQSNAITLLYNAIGQQIISNQAWIESNKIVTEQILGTTAAITDQSSAWGKLGQIAIYAIAGVQATLIPFTKVVLNDIGIVTGAIASLITAAVGGVLLTIQVVGNKMIQFAELIRDTVHGIINGIISGVNSVTGAVGIPAIPQLQAGPAYGKPLSFGQKFVEGFTLPSFKFTIDSFNGAANAAKQLTTNLDRLDHALLQQRTYEEAARRDKDPATRQNFLRVAREQSTRPSDLLRSGYSREELITAGFGVEELNRDVLRAQGLNAPALSGGDAAGRKQTKSQIAKAIQDARDYRDIVQFAKEQGFAVTSTTGGRHNKGSQHYQKLAADLSIKGKSELEISRLIQDALLQGFTVRDERKRPPGQRVYGGPHIHLGIGGRNYLPDPFLAEFAKNLKAGDASVIDIGGKDYPVTKAEAQFAAQVALGRVGTGVRGTLATGGGPVRAQAPFSLAAGTLTETPDQEYRRKLIEGQTDRETALDLRAQNFELEKSIALRAERTSQEERYFDIQRDLFAFEQTSADKYLENVRRRNLVDSERLSLGREAQQLQDEIATHAENAAQRYEVAWLRAQRNIQLEQDRIQESIIDSQIKIADHTVFHADRANAKLLEFFAAQKGVTDIITDFRIGIVQTTYDYIDKGLDRIFSKLGPIGGLIKQIASDFIRLLANRYFLKFFGLEGGAGPAGPSGGGGGIGSIVTSFLGGGLGRGGGGSNAYGGANVAATGPSGSVGNIVSQITGGLNPFAGASVQNLFGGSNLGSTLTSSSAQAAAQTASSHAITDALVEAGVGVAGRHGTQAAAKAASGAAGKGILGKLGGLLPVLGAGFGGLLGGQSAFGQILGTAGGALAGIVGGSFSALGGAGFAALGALGPIAAIAAPLLLFGGWLLGRNKQRRADEGTRNEAMVQSLSQLDEIIAGLRGGRLDSATAISQAMQIRSEYLKAMNGLKDKKTRRIAVADVRRLDQKIDEIKREGARADVAIARDRAIIPTFGGGGSYSSAFQGRLGIGGYSRGDVVPIMAAPDETVVFNPMQRAALGGDLAFKRAGVPGFANTPATASGVMNSNAALPPKMLVVVVADEESADQLIKQAPADTFAQKMKLHTKKTKLDGYAGDLADLFARG